MQRFVYLGVFLSLLLALPFGSAELLFTQPHAAYNFGDELDVTLTLHPATRGTDFVRIDLLCDGEQVTLHTSLLTVSEGSTHAIRLSPRLDSPLFAPLGGECYLRGFFGSEETASQSFILTRDITTEIVVPTSVVMPGASFEVTGTARKVNGQPLTGFARVSLEGTNFSFSRPVTNGAFTFNITLPSRIAPGEHLLRVESYEENERGVVLNEGTASSDIIVQVVLTRGDITFEKVDVTPKEQFVFSVEAYDQIDSRLERDARYNVYAPQSEQPVITQLTRTFIPQQIEVKPTWTPGYWRIEAVIGGLMVKKLFYVNEYEIVTFSLENNNTLVITNAGNVPYQKSVEISIGEHTSLKDLSLGLGESKRFKLSAPSAAYDVNVRDGNRSFSALGVPLTGRAIAVGEVRGSFFNVWWAGLFIMIIVGMAFVTNIYMAKRRTRSATGERALPMSTHQKMSGTGVGIPQGVTREMATVIALRVDSTSALAHTALDNALGIAQKTGASITSHLNQHLIAFSPRFTKRLENDLLAVQIAKEIETTLKGSNEEGTFDFGVGIGKGEIITHPEKPGQFTSVGTVVPLTKRLAHSSKRDVLISDDLHAALRAHLKAEKVAGTANAWRVSSIVSRESHKSFIDGFLKRHAR